MQVVRDTDERQKKQHVAVACITVLAQDMQHLAGILVPGHDAAIGAFSEEVQEAVSSMAVMAGEREEGELAVPEWDVSIVRPEAGGEGLCQMRPRTRTEQHIQLPESTRRLS